MKKEHSFYKEAQESSWSDSQGNFSWKKLGKKSTKYLKIAAGLYLGVAAIWGCVQGFIIKTSPQVAQGLETYINYESVIPNFFQAQQNIAYQVQTDMLVEYTDVKAVNGQNYLNTNGLAPLPFLNENPEFGKVGYLKDNPLYDSKDLSQILINRDINGDGVINQADVTFWEQNTRDKLYLRGAEFKFAANPYQLPSYSYQVSLEDVNFLSNFLTILSDPNATNQAAGFFNRPAYSNYALLYDIPNDNKNYAVPVWRKLSTDKTTYEYVEKPLGAQGGFVVEKDGKLQYEANMFVTPSTFLTPNSTWYYDQITAFGLDGTSGTAGITWAKNNVSNFSTSSDLDQYSIAANQIIYAINTKQFIDLNPLAGTTPSSLVLIDEQTGSSITAATLLLNIEGQMQTDPNLTPAEKAIAQSNINRAKTYSAYLNPLPSPLFPSDIFGLYSPSQVLVPTPTWTASSFKLGNGATIAIVPSTGTPALTPSDEASNIFYGRQNVGNDSGNDGVGYRVSNYYDLPHGWGDDQKTANEGWMLLGEKEANASDSENRRDAFLVYDSTGAATKTLMSQQKTAFKGNNNGLTDKPNEVVLENKIKSVIDDGSFANFTSYEFTINDSNYSLGDFLVPLIGLASISESGLYANQQNYINPLNQRGATNQVTEYNSADPWATGDFSIKTTSSLDYSIQGSGNSDVDNYSRYAMVGWGEAWAWGGVYYGTFVWPLSKLSLWIQSWIPYQTLGAWAVVFGVFLIIMLLRGLGTLMTWGRQNSQNKMQELQLQVANIKAKYTDVKTNKQAKQRQQMEIQALYKKHGVNPLGSMSTMLITLPIFLALWTIISSIPLYKVAAMGGFIFALNPFKGMFNTGAVGLIYALFAALIISVQIISSKLPTWLSDKRKNVKNLDEATKAQMKKQNRTTTIMMVVFVILGFTIPSLLGLYWVFSGLYTIGHTLFQHFQIEKKAIRSRTKFATKASSK